MDVSAEAWNKIFDVNVKSTFLLLKEVTPHMTKHGYGAITMVSTISGYTPIKGLGAYAISKSALFGLTKYMAHELASSGIRVNCIAPGLIKTAFSGVLWDNGSIKDSILQKIPMRRMGTPNECAGIESFLSSDDASYITGETIVIAGGGQSRL